MSFPLPPSHPSRFMPHLSFADTPNSLKDKVFPFNQENEQLYKKLFEHHKKEYDHDLNTVKDALSIALGETNFQAIGLFLEDNEKLTALDFIKTLSKAIQYRGDKISTGIEFLETRCNHEGARPPQPLAFEDKARLFAIITPSALSVKARQKLLSSEPLNKSVPPRSTSSSDSKRPSRNSSSGIASSGFVNAIGRAAAVASPILSSSSAASSSGAHSRSSSVMSLGSPQKRASSAAILSSLGFKTPSFKIQGLKVYESNPKISLDSREMRLTSFVDFYKELKVARTNNQTKLVKLQVNVETKIKNALEKSKKSKTNRMYKVWRCLNTFLEKECERTREEPTLVNAHILNDNCTFVVWRMRELIPTPKKLNEEFGITDHKKTRTHVMKNMTIHDEGCIPLINSIMTEVTNDYLFAMQPNTWINYFIEHAPVNYFEIPPDRVQPIGNSFTSPHVSGKIRFTHFDMSKPNKLIFDDSATVRQFFTATYPEEGSTLDVSDVGSNFNSKLLLCDVPKPNSSETSELVLLQMNYKPLQTIANLALVHHDDYAPVIGQKVPTSPTPKTDISLASLSQEQRRTAAKVVRPSSLPSFYSSKELPPPSPAHSFRPLSPSIKAMVDFFEEEEEEEVFESPKS